MSIKRQADPWASIQEDLRRLESEEPTQAQEAGERIPCPDESCVGTLGESGSCRLCGARPGVSFQPGPCPLPGREGTQAVPSSELEGEEEPQEEGERVCCADDSCVGTVDEQGYCRICGLKWKEGGYQEGEALVYREDSLL